MRHKRVLVVEDERDLAELLVYNLKRAGHEVTAVHDGRSALNRISVETPDLVILDLMLPELSGTEVASRIRTNPVTAGVPIIMVTAKADEVDQLVGLSVGADDYVTKPFSMKVLLARVEAVLRRAGEGAAAGTGVLRLGPVEINLDTHRVQVSGQVVQFTLTEFRILVALIQAQGKVLSRATLMGRAMGPGVMVTERTIDVHVTAIRKKLGDAGARIRTVRGVGYSISPEPGGTGEN
jgi:DNA-binding response OmpR family regulator